MSSSKIKNNNKAIDALYNVFKFCGRLPENIDVSMELQLARGGRVKNNLYFWAHLYKGSQDP